MSYAWLETSVMGVIFIAAALFAIRHFMPDVDARLRHFFLRKNSREIDIHLVSAASADACRTQCSACNGCSMAGK